MPPSSRAPVRPAPRAACPVDARDLHQSRRNASSLAARGGHPAGIGTKTPAASAHIAGGCNELSPESPRRLAAFAAALAAPLPCAPPTPAPTAATSTRVLRREQGPRRRRADRPEEAEEPVDTLVFTYTPVEDPAVYEKVFEPFTEHLAQVHRQEASCSSRCSRTPRRSRRCARGACTSAASRPARRRSR